MGWVGSAARVTLGTADDMQADNDPAGHWTSFEKIFISGRQFLKIVLGTIKEVRSADIFPGTGFRLLAFQQQKIRYKNRVPAGYSFDAWKKGCSIFFLGFGSMFRCPIMTCSRLCPTQEAWCTLWGGEFLALSTVRLSHTGHPDHHLWLKSCAHIPCAWWGS